VKILRVSIEKAAQMLSETPAKIVKIDDYVGSIAAGKRAGILISLCHFLIINTLRYIIIR
jgi:N-acetylglucosamine-6-phosphate deacetylase